jgi:hypothetical protein
MIVAAGVGALAGRVKIRQYMLLTDGETGDVGGVRSPGTVKLSGTVETESAFESPVGGEECVLAVWEIEEWRQRGKKTRWVPVGGGSYVVPFAIDDGTGSVAVDLRERTGDGTVEPVSPEFFDDAAELDGSVETLLADPQQVTKSQPGFTPGRLKRLETIEGIGAPTTALVKTLDVGRPEGERRYAEHVVAPGDEVFLMADAVVDDGADRPLAPGDLTVQPTGGTNVLFSEFSEAEVLSWVRSRLLVVPWALVMGLLGVTVVGGALAVPGLDPMPFLLGGLALFVFWLVYVGAY